MEVGNKFEQVAIEHKLGNINDNELMQEALNLAREIELKKNHLFNNMPNMN